MNWCTTNSWNNEFYFYLSLPSDKNLTIMASIKELKDDINYITYDLISECFTFKNYHPEKDGEADKVIKDIVRLRNELVARVNHPESKEDPKKLRAHFNKIRVDLGKLVKLVEDLGQHG
jgi:hypothetical protein